MRIGLASILLACTVAIALGQSSDPHLTFRIPAYDPTLTLIDTDYFLLVDKDDHSLQMAFSSGYRKSTGGAWAITIEALYLAKTDLYKPADKRDFSLIVDGDRIDLGGMLYFRYPAEKIETAVYSGSPIESLFPDDLAVRKGAAFKTLVVGHLTKYFMGKRGEDAFARIKNARQITLKIGPDRVALTEGQISTLRNFLQWRKHGK